VNSSIKRACKKIVKIAIKHKLAIAYKENNNSRMSFRLLKTPLLLCKIKGEMKSQKRLEIAFHRRLKDI
jgi:hypothetical protein